MSEITHGVMGMPFEMAMGSELSRRQFYQRARQQHCRYEHVRQLNPLQFAEVFQRTLAGEPFDDIIDARIAADRDAMAMTGAGA